jgi:hypothetical protein
MGLTGGHAKSKKKGSKDNIYKDALFLENKSHMVLQNWWFKIKFNIDTTSTNLFRQRSIFFFQFLVEPPTKTFHVKNCKSSLRK